MTITSPLISWHLIFKIQHGFTMLTYWKEQILNGIIPSPKIEVRAIISYGREFIPSEFALQIVMVYGVIQSEVFQLKWNPPLGIHGGPIHFTF